MVWDQPLPVGRRDHLGNGLGAAGRPGRWHGRGSACWRRPLHAPKSPNRHWPEIRQKTRFVVVKPLNVTGWSAPLQHVLGGMDRDRWSSLDRRNRRGSHLGRGGGVWAPMAAGEWRLPHKRTFLQQPLSIHIRGSTQQTAGLHTQAGPSSSPWMAAWSGSGPDIAVWAPGLNGRRCVSA